ncbi:Tafazzin [Psilocybe cubensis]|uniref:Tafazzin family protein n=2 Tax=Psilocybe cubensis TaxID=181762 RepID=A0A8H7Y1P8_PSICU|nr:Tafazzin [Psilocybe cubensis]KAH9482947.1 Tafazzin [Psilocybe cubensis]
MSPVLSAATVTTVGLACKAFLSSGLASIQVHGLHILKDALEGPDRDSRRGILTVCNHISTLDDPVTWGVLPVRYYLSSRTTRWALGASDIMFTNPVFSTFFSLGQTLETFRGKGIYQDAVDTAIQKLNEGQWVHLYGEGKVNQPKDYRRDKLGRVCIQRFKWGVGRILMETEIPPIVIPMWITGFDQLMPEGRPFPNKYLPRIGARMSVTFGQPVPTEKLEEALDVSPRDSDVISSATAGSNEQLKGWLGEAAALRSEQEQIYTSLVRQKVTAIIHRAVEDLGRSILPPLLKEPISIQ